MDLRLNAGGTFGGLGAFLGLSSLIDRGGNGAISICIFLDF
jgi:hypothetical protein